MESIMREVTETELHPENMNKKKGVSLRMSWKPLTETMEQEKEVLL
jgi:hypothetical protein